MRIIAQVSAKVTLYKEVEIEIISKETEQEIQKAILEEAEHVFDKLISLSHGRKPSYEVESFEGHEDDPDEGEEKDGISYPANCSEILNTRSHHIREEKKENIA